MCIDRRQRGFTLIELIVFIIIVSVGLAGVLASLNVSVKSSADPLQPKQALAIAESVLEEVLLRHYCDPDTMNTATTPPTCGANTVESARSDFDDVDDYNGYSQATASSLDGTLFASGYALQSVSVSATTVNAVAAKLVTVTVRSPSGQTYSLSGIKMNY